MKHPIDPYQIEIQLAGYRHLPARIAYTWADLYGGQLHSGEDDAALPDWMHTAEMRPAMNTLRQFSENRAIKRGTAAAWEYVG